MSDTMTTDENAFFNAIDADYHDQAPRGVYADWLDEHGRSDEASYIRRMLRLCSHDFSDNPRKWDERAVRLDEMRRPFDSRWLERVDLPGMDDMLQQGFVEDDDDYEPYTPPSYEPTYSYTPDPEPEPEPKPTPPPTPEPAGYRPRTKEEVSELYLGYKPWTKEEVEKNREIIRKGQAALERLQAMLRQK